MVLSIMGPSAPPCSKCHQPRAGNKSLSGPQESGEGKRQSVKNASFRALATKLPCRMELAQELGEVGGDGAGEVGRGVPARLGFREGRRERVGPSGLHLPQLHLPAWAPLNRTPSRSGPWKQAGSEEEGPLSPVGSSVGCPRPQPGCNVPTNTSTSCKNLFRSWSKHASTHHPLRDTTSLSKPQLLVAEWRCRALARIN